MSFKNIVSFKPLFLTFAFTTLSLISFGQDLLPCGTIEPDNVRFFEQKEYDVTKEALLSSIKKDPRNFMVSLHIIRSSSGSGGIKKSLVLAALNEMNETYANADIVFELCEDVFYIDNDLYIETVPSEVSGLISNNNVDGTINIYFIPQVINSSGDGICGNATFPSTTPTQRRILMDNNCVTNGSTLIHEMGHYFGLLHTHSTSNGIEYVERVNCTSAGDRFCDTPADPRLSSSTVTNCVYVGGEVDPNGVAYESDPSNFMSYAPKSCRIDFSPDQYAHISLIAATDNDYHLNTCDLPDFELTSTQSSELTVSNFADIDFDLDISTLNLNSAEVLEYVIKMTNAGSTTAAILEEGTLDFDPENSSASLSFRIPFTEDFFSLQTILVEIDPANKIVEPNEDNNSFSYEITHAYRVDRSSFIYPNPANDYISLYLNNQLTGAYTMRVFDDSGKMVIEQTAKKNTLYELETLDILTLVPGMYYLQVEFTNGDKEVFKFIRL